MPLKTHTLYATLVTCGQCGTPVILAATGRPRRFCGDACRQAAHRARERHETSGEMSRNPLILTARVGGNAAAFRDVLGLHVPLGSTVADVTFGKGVFWRKVPPGDYDVLPTDIAMGVDLRHLPYPDGSIDCVVLDPPYQSGLFCAPTQMMAGSGSHAPFRERYSTGVAVPDDGSPKWHAAVIDLYRRGGSEAYRVLRGNGVLIVKCQDEVSTNVNRLTHVEIIDYYVKRLGFIDDVDLFVVVRHNRPGVSRRGRQVHARKNHSYLLVFKKRGGA